GLLALAASPIQPDVASHENEPGRRIARRAVLRPRLQGAQTRILKGFFRRVEIAEVAQQRGDRLRTRGRDRRVNPGYVGHLRSARTRGSRRYSPAQAMRPRYTPKSVCENIGESMRRCVAMAPPSSPVSSTAPSVAVRGMASRMAQATSIAPI